MTGIMHFISLNLGNNMASVNKVILVGNLGRDPEVRYNPDGFTVANVSIATTFSWNDKATGGRREETEWHRVVFYNRQAEVVGQYLKKGSQIYVEGRLRTRKYMGKDGIERYTTEIIADTMQMLGGRNTGDTSAEYDTTAAGTYSAPARPTTDGGFSTQGTPPRVTPAATPTGPYNAPAGGGFGGASPTPSNPAPANRPSAPAVADNFSDMDEDVPF